jgi:hypothetical protein
MIHTNMAVLMKNIFFVAEFFLELTTCKVVVFLLKFITIYSTITKHGYIQFGIWYSLKLVLDNPALHKI